MNEDSHQAAIALSPRALRRREQARQTLLVAARQVFAAKGYHDATIAEITQAADMSVGAFYLHFHDKEAAFRTILEQGFAELRATVQAAFTANEHPNLTTLLHIILRAAYAQRDLFRIALTGNERPLRAMRAQVTLIETITDLLEQAQMSGILASSTPAPLLARFVAGSISQSIAWWFEHDAPLPDDMVAHLTTFLGDGLPAALFTSEL
jgi:AcrR family transcriptional regulator